MLQGTSHPDFWAVAKAFGALLPRKGRGGAAVCVYHRGEKVVDLWGGTRDEAGRSWDEDTVSLSYSTTKGVASTLLHVLVDRGALAYDDPVARYWPEFAAEGKAGITVRQLLCHEAGLYDIRSMVDDASRMLDWEYMADALARSAPAHAPGAAHGYHALTYGWLVGELVQRVSGKPFGELLASELAGPLGLDGLFVGLPAEHDGRRARLILARRAGSEDDTVRRIRGFGRGVNRVLRTLRLPIDLTHARAALMPKGMDRFDFNDAAFVAACVPAANGMFTARSLARLYAALAGGGELDGVRILSRETVAHAARVQNRTIDRVVPLPMQWRLGYHRIPLPGRGERAFGHFGFGGSGAWADPDRDLALGLTLNSGVGTPFGDLRIVRVTRAAARAADRRL